MIIIGSDHAGYELKEEIKKFLDEQDLEYKDVGTDSTESTDYPDYAKKVAEAVQEGNRGILICGTGIGMSITANKFKGIRAAVCHDEFTAKVSREHNNANILCMGGRVLGPELARKMTKVWLETGFSEEERHHRRVEKMDHL